MNIFLVIPLLIMLPSCTSKKDSQEPRVCNVKTVRRSSLITSSSHVHSLNSSNNDDSSLLSLQTKSVSAQDQAERCEARLSDVPMPIMAKVESTSFDQDNGTMLVCSIEQTKDQVAEFYKDEMERLGWEQVSLFDADEMLLSYQKPGKSCVISVRPAKKSWERSRSVKASIFVSA